MPELPEVETIVQDLRASGLIGDSIDAVHVFWDRSLAGISAKTFCQTLEGQTLLAIDRRGKFIVFKFSNHDVLVHLRMTGKFILDEGKVETTSHERVRLIFKSGVLLRYEDQRKFGKWTLLQNAEEKLSELGLEPLSKEFTLQAFEWTLERSSQQIKPFLLNQRYVVGLGNIYADEALWLAKIHPSKKGKRFIHSNH